MIIQPIVEGPGDIQAVPALLSRLLAEDIGCPFSRIAQPMKLARGHMVQEALCRKHLRIANLACNYVVLFIDSDDDCCKQLNISLSQWAAKEIYKASFDTIGIEREFESWLLAGVESLRGLRGIAKDAVPPFNPSLVRGAKERLTKLMPEGVSYSETVDQAALTRSVSIEQVVSRSPSFARLVRKLRQRHAFHCELCSKFQYIPPEQ